MAVSPQSVDAEHLRRTLQELGYRESIPNDAAPLVHHILTDLNQATKQYTDLLKHYDELFARWQDDHPDTARHGGSPANDLTHLTGLDSSMLGVTGPMDESFMLKTVEEARSRIEQLGTELEHVKGENAQLRAEREALQAEVQQSQMTSQELSQLLHTKHTQQEALHSELVALKKTTETGITFQLNSLVKTAISLLPSDLQVAYTAKVTDSSDSLINLLGDVLGRLRREMEQRVATLNEVKSMAERAKKDHEAAEEAAAKVKGLVTMYQGQIAELMSRLHQKDFERGLQADIASQISALEGYNNMIKEKLTILDRLKQESFNFSAPVRKI